MVEGEFIHGERHEAMSERAVTGLRIEPHHVTGTQVCVAYRHGKRVAVLYFDSERVRLVYEADEQVWVEERTGPMSFERVFEKGSSV